MQLADARFLVLDTETTGLDPASDRVVQLGAVWLDEQQRVLHTFETLVHPGEGVEVPPEASAIHHITNEMLEGAPSFPDALAQLFSQGPPHNALAAHNAPFDMAFLQLGDRWPVLDTLRLARKLWPELPRHGNQYLRYRFKLAVPGAEGLAAHSALPDALVTASILRFALAELRTRAKTPEALRLDRLLERLAEPMDLRKRPIAFGKHRGKTWEELAATDRGYLRWILEQMTDLDEDVRHTVRALLQAAD